MDLPEKKINPKTNDQIGIKIKDGEFAWLSGIKPTITKINLELCKGELAIIIGAVGCGKTTLLNSLMHETV